MWPIIEVVGGGGGGVHRYRPGDDRGSGITKKVIKKTFIGMFMDLKEDRHNKWTNAKKLKNITPEIKPRNPNKYANMYYSF